jgi:hypothetical protein
MLPRIHNPTVEHTPMKLSGSGNAESLIGSQMAAMICSFECSKVPALPHHIQKGFAERSFARNDQSARVLAVNSCIRNDTRWWGRTEWGAMRLDYSKILRARGTPQHRPCPTIASPSCSFPTCKIDRHSPAIMAMRLPLQSVVYQKADNTQNNSFEIKQ